MGRHIHARVLRSEKGCRIRVTHVHTRSDCVYTKNDTVRLNYASRFVRVIYSSHTVSIKLDTVTQRLMNYVMIPYRWKRFIHHVDRARHQYSIAEAGPVAGGKERKRRRQTIFFTPLDPFNIDADEAELIADINKTKESTSSNSLDT